MCQFCHFWIPEVPCTPWCPIRPCLTVRAQKHGPTPGFRDVFSNLNRTWRGCSHSSPPNWKKKSGALKYIKYKKVFFSYLGETFYTIFFFHGGISQKYFELVVILLSFYSRKWTKFSNWTILLMADRGAYTFTINIVKKEYLQLQRAGIFEWWDIIAACQNLA